jgi:Fur family peroxide stress response transcriptional regulator
MSQTSYQNEAKLRAFRKLSRQIGLKLTHQRLEIFNVLSSTEDHPSPEDVFEEVKKRIPTIAFDTVYRTLSLFERLGLISKVNYLDGRKRYDSVTERHCHLICTLCRKIQDFTWPEVDQLQLPKETMRWGSIENKYIELRGLCQDCLTKDMKSKVNTYPNRNKEKNHER